MRLSDEPAVTPLVPSLLSRQRNSHLSAHSNLRKLPQRKQGNKRRCSALILKIHVQHPLGWLLLKSNNNKCWWECGEIRALEHGWWSLLWKMRRQFLKTLTGELPHDPATPLRGMYSKEGETGSQGDTCTSVFITALLPTAKRGREPKCLLMDEWINKYDLPIQ